MGSAPDVAGALANELGHEGDLALDYAYWMARYPVTVSQYHAFIKGRGYDHKPWWSEAGWAWRQVQTRHVPDLWSRQRKGANCPVVGVTWFEAEAYACWLDSRLRKNRTKIPKGYAIRLPTEAEWEMAARGPSARAYPWGEEMKGDEANVRDALRGPSSVGLFSRGGTPQGLMDMGGNVWEWTLSLDRPYPYRSDDGRNDLEYEGQRVLRGGSYDAGPRRARGAARAHAPMREVARDIGFRLTLSLSDSAL